MSLLAAEEELLDWYHKALMERLDELGVGGSDFTPELLRAHYAAARCDYMRYMLGRGWTACSAGDAKLIEVVDQDLRQFDSGQLLPPEGYEERIASVFSSL